MSGKYDKVDDINDKDQDTIIKSLWNSLSLSLSLSLFWSDLLLFYSTNDIFMWSEDFSLQQSLYFHVRHPARVLLSKCYVCMRVASTPSCW